MLLTFAVVMASLVMHDAGGVKTVVRGPIKFVGSEESEDAFDAAVLEDEMKGAVEIVVNDCAYAYTA